MGPDEKIYKLISGNIYQHIETGKYFRFEEKVIDRDNVRRKMTPCDKPIVVREEAVDEEDYEVEETEEDEEEEVDEEKTAKKKSKKKVRK